MKSVWYEGMGNSWLSGNVFLWEIYYDPLVMHNIFHWMLILKLHIVTGHPAWHLISSQ